MGERRGQLCWEGSHKICLLPQLARDVCKIKHHQEVRIVTVMTFQLVIQVNHAVTMTMTMTTTKMMMMIGTLHSSDKPRQDNPFPKSSFFLTCNLIEFVLQFIFIKGHYTNYQCRITFVKVILRVKFPSQITPSSNNDTSPVQSSPVH